MEEARARKIDCMQDHNERKAARKQRYELVNARKAELRRQYDEYVAMKYHGVYPGYADDVAEYMAMRHREASKRVTLM